MANKFMHLPEEIIMHIVSDLKASIQQENNCIWVDWGKVSERAVAQHLPGRQDLRSLYLSCPRFNNLLERQVYEDVHVRDSYFENKWLKLYMRTINDDFQFGEHLTRISVFATSAVEFEPLFHLPNIHTIEIRGFDDMNALEWEEEGVAASLVAASPVKVLRLIKCGALEAALAMVFSWPTALEELWFEANQICWYGLGHNEAEPEGGWESAAFIRALETQRNSLRSLTMTRTWQDHEGLGCSSPVDLTGFVALTSLRIYHVFIGWGLDLDGRRLYETLPKQLETFEIYYDDTDLDRFADNGQPNSWLDEIVQHNRNKTRLPELKCVTVLSPEGDNEDFDPQFGQITEAYEIAGIELHLNMHYQAYRE